MLPTISTTHRPATDLGYLLHKNPARGPQTFDLTYGKAHVLATRRTRCAAYDQWVTEEKARRSRTEMISSTNGPKPWNA